MPHGWPITEWTKPLKRSEKIALEKYLLKEGYDIKVIKNMDTHRRKKLWKLYKEQNNIKVSEDSQIKKTLKELLCFWR
jgi:ribulose bisphosphate carboxylase small subunit